MGRIKVALIPSLEPFKNSHQRPQEPKLLLGSRLGALWFDGFGNRRTCGLAEGGTDHGNFWFLWSLVRPHEWPSAFFARKNAYNSAPRPPPELIFGASGRAGFWLSYFRGSGAWFWDCWANFIDFRPKFGQTFGSFGRWWPAINGRHSLYGDFPTTLRRPSRDFPSILRRLRLFDDFPATVW